MSLSSEQREVIRQILRTPPAPKVYHRDRIDWGQVELILEEIEKVFPEEETEQFTVKIVFGEHASSLHENGASDERVEECGNILEREFETKAEMEAYLQGLDDLDGWMGWTHYDPDNLKTGEE